MAAFSDQQYRLRVSCILHFQLTVMMMLHLMLHGHADGILLARTHYGMYYRGSDILNTYSND